MNQRFQPYRKWIPERKSWIWVIVIVLGVFLMTGCTPASSTSGPDEMEDKMIKETISNPNSAQESPTTTAHSPKEESGKDATEVAPTGETSTPTTPSREERLELVKTPKVTPADLSKLIGDPITGEVPDNILGDIISDLLERTNADSGDIKVIRSEFVTWNDGSLGCPQKGMYYTQALVDGYWVVLQIEGVVYDYRATVSGYFSLCEGRNGIIIPPPEGSVPKD